MSKQLVSVIIPTCNRKEHVVKAISSVLEQTYKTVEIIVIDDGSTDGTGDVIYKFRENNPGIIFIRNESNLGFVKALNKGISSAKGEYIARLDDDDYWVDPHKLEKQIDFLEKNPEYVLVGGGAIETDKNDKEIVKYLLPENDENIRNTILINNVFVHSSVVFRKNGWEKAGGYDEQFGFFADWALWLELGRLGKFYNFSEFFICYLNQEKDNGSNSHDHKIRRKLNANIKLRKKYKSFYPGYKKALLLCFASYFYSFIPFKNKLWPIILWLRKSMFGAPPYKYFN